MVCGPDGAPAVGRCLPGRGAWLCAGSPACLDLAERRKALARALRCPVADASLAGVREVLLTAPTGRRPPDW